MNAAFNLGRTQDKHELDFDLRYRVEGYGGVAWRAIRWETKPDCETSWTGYEIPTGKVECVMVGDNRKFSFDPEDLTPLDDDEFCSCCGQIGCGWGT